MAKLWSLLLAFLLAGLPLGFTVDRPSFQVTAGFHEKDDCVPRSYAFWNVTTDRAVYRVEQYDQLWDWRVARSEAVDIALILEHTLQTIDEYCGGKRGEKLLVDVISVQSDDPLYDIPFVTHDTVVLTFQHIRHASYVEAIARAYLSETCSWVAFGVAGVINGDILDESYLADYLSREGTGLLRLSGIRFSMEICDQYDVGIAKGVATSLVRFIKIHCPDDSLLDVVRGSDIGVIKRAWLESIGVNLPYRDDDEMIWNKTRLIRSAAIPHLIEIGDSLFEIQVEKGHWLLQYDQSYEGSLKTADDFERVIAISAIMQAKVKDALRTILPEDQLAMGTIHYPLTPLLFAGEPVDMPNANVYPSVAAEYLTRPVEVFQYANDLERGTLAYVVADQLAHMYLDAAVSPSMPEADMEQRRSLSRDILLERGVAAYVAMTLPRSGGFSQNLDSAYVALQAAVLGKYPVISGVPKDAVSRYYETVIGCYLAMGGSLANASTFDPVLYTDAAAFATMREMDAAQTWEDFHIQKGAQVGMTPEQSTPACELVTSFVCFLMKEASLPELIGVLRSDEWEAVYDRTYEQLFGEWKESLPYIMAAKSDWMGVQ